MLIYQRVLCMDETCLEHSWTGDLGDSQIPSMRRSETEIKYTWPVNS